MRPERPDLSSLAPEVRAYIEHLEAELQRLERAPRRSQPTLEPSEPPTTVNVITGTTQGRIKRTPRHLYVRQRRGGMGVFGMESGEEDWPAFLILADEGDRFVVITDRGRGFSLPVAELPESPLHSRGDALSRWLPLQEGERPQLLLPVTAKAVLYLVSARGWVRRLGGNIIANLKPGTMLHVRPDELPVAACWGSGGDHLFVATAQGKAIRFSERQVPVKGGCLALRLDPGDEAVAVTTVPEEGGVFLMGKDGKGTIRLMRGFRANKAPGAGGKQAMKTAGLVGAAQVTEQDDIFAISHLGKVIRFAAAEVPAKEGVVQGVNCMALRRDEVSALAVSPAPGNPNS